MPGVHFEQVEDPFTLEYVPAGQGRHALESTSANVPTGQVEAMYKHDEDPVTDNVPDKHCLHVAESTVMEKVPAGHNKQVPFTI